MVTTLQPGEFFDPVNRTVWGHVSVGSIPCDEPGCYVRAEFELLRTVVGTAQPAMRCRWHAPQFATIATDPVEKVLSVSATKYECPECWNTGFFRGYGIKCKRGCKPGKPVEPTPDNELRWWNT